MSDSNWGAVGCKHGTLESTVPLPNLCTKTTSSNPWFMTSHLQGRQSRNLENQYFHDRVHEREKALKRGLSAKHIRPGNPKTKRLLHELWSNSYYSQDSNSPRSTMESLNAQSGCILDIVWEISENAWNESVLHAEWMLDNLVCLLAPAAIYQATWKHVSTPFLRKKKASTYMCRTTSLRYLFYAYAAL